VSVILSSKKEISKNSKAKKEINVKVRERKKVKKSTFSCMKFVVCLKAEREEKITSFSFSSRIARAHSNNFQGQYISFFSHSLCGAVYRYKAIF
jgi:hypothetical protein